MERERSLLEQWDNWLMIIITRVISLVPITIPYFGFEGSSVQDYMNADRLLTLSMKTEEKVQAHKQFLRKSHLEQRNNIHQYLTEMVG